MDFSQITDFLFVGTTPMPEDYRLLRELGVGLVINMRFERRPYPDLEQPPLPVLWLPSFDMPLFPIPLRHLIKGVQAALQTIEQGEKVYAHCHKGVHRGAVMAAAILIAQGYLPDQAMQLIREQRAIAHPEIWYMRRRILRFANAWREQRDYILNSLAAIANPDAGETPLTETG